MAFVGATGAGKSTIARLLFRFYDLHDSTCGSISIDGEKALTSPQHPHCGSTAQYKSAMANDRNARARIARVWLQTAAVVLGDTTRLSLAHARFAITCGRYGYPPCHSGISPNVNWRGASGCRSRVGVYAAVCVRTHVCVCVCVCVCVVCLCVRGHAIVWMLTGAICVE
jgi:hypothetical protein